MKSIQQLLDLRKQIKAKKPNFIREDAERKCVPAKWKRPVGIHNKVRHGFQGHISKVKPGFGSPKQVKGLDRTGLRPILINNVDDLLKLTKSDGAIIASSLGIKKKIEILKKCIEKKIIILNIKKPEEYIKSIENKLQENKKQKQELKKKREQKAKTIEKKDEKGENKLSDKLDQETKKEEDKKQLDKILTTKEN